MLDQQRPRSLPLTTTTSHSTLARLSADRSKCVFSHRPTERGSEEGAVEQGFLAKVPAGMRRRKFICSTEFASRASALHPFPPSTLWEDFVHATVFQGRTHKAAVAGRTGPCPTSLSLSLPLPLCGKIWSCYKISPQQLFVLFLPRPPSAAEPRSFLLLVAVLPLFLPLSLK